VISRVRTSTAGRKFLQTYADGVWKDNLLALPEVSVITCRKWNAWSPDGIQMKGRPQFQGLVERMVGAESCFMMTGSPHDLYKPAR
jgi:Protein of unknown function (DUF3892)